MDQSPVQVIELDPPFCGELKENSFPDISLDDLANNGAVIVWCRAGKKSQICTGVADGEPVTIHNCEHCGLHEFL